MLWNQFNSSAATINTTTKDPPIIPTRFSSAFKLSEYPDRLSTGGAVTDFADWTGLDFVSA